MSAKKMLLLGCGGAGLNIASLFERYRGHNDDAITSMEVSYVDTSRANLKSELDINRFFHIEGLDGSGQIRAENVSAIKTSIPTIVNKFKPVDINIVIFSADGGKRIH